MDSDALQFLEHAQQGRYVTGILMNPFPMCCLWTCLEVAALCLVLHDHFFTCRQEWKFIWIRKWSFSKVLFFLVRLVLLCQLSPYLPHLQSRYGTLGILFTILLFRMTTELVFQWLVMVDRPIICSAWFCFQSWSGFYSAVIIEAVLIFRIYAMYHGEKRLMYSLGALFVCQLGGMAYVLQAGCRGLTAIADPLPGVQECAITSTISYEYAYWAALLFFETLLFYLSMRKAYEHIRQYAFRFEELVVSRRVGEVLIRDGVMYFPFIFLSYLANLVLFTLSPRYLAQVAPHIALALRSVLTNRLLLNVSRKFYYPNAGQPMGNDGDLTGRDSVLGFIVWASPARRGPSRSQLGLDTVDSQGVEGGGGRGREAAMRLVKGRGLRRVDEADDEYLKDADERVGVMPNERVEEGSGSPERGDEGGRRMLQASGPRATVSLTSLDGDPLGAAEAGVAL
ncbi:hypothetical protein CALCODRAFT_485668 [Calocera cornea HHB12733]|uniref:DUF6533 domain-containing protein n=1 Tax=Calocera cornea HHB12733 TaxID=1353952 RepID=A0A165E825_9BASI|nr:hypothetical protein CALCODRAFT_485668 [Calocera cornea HHB12733]